MAEAPHPDLCVIGAGPGGLALAMSAAVAGTKVVLIEKNDLQAPGPGAAPILSKSLIAAAALAHGARRAGGFGIDLSDPAIAFARVRAHGEAALSRMAPARSLTRLKALGVQVIQGTARFTSPRQIEVGGHIIQARRFVVATGSSPLIPPLRGIETIRVLTHDTIFDLSDLPSHLLVLGADAVGLELAQAFRRLGSAVTVVTPQLALPGEDPELAQVVLAALRDEGVALREEAVLSHVDPAPNGLRLFIEGDGTGIEASHLLVSSGRVPNVAGLGLDAAGIRFDASGIRVGHDLRTSNSRVYAIGDVTGGVPSVQAATYQAGLVARTLVFRSTAKQVPGMIPRVIYTDPEIASAGLSEAEAREAGHPVSILRWPLAENDRAQAEGQTRGHIKVVCGRKGEILGAGLAGARAGELISMWQLAVSQRTKIGSIAQMVLPSPTLSEISQRAAVLTYASALRSPWLKRVLRFLRLFG